IISIMAGAIVPLAFQQIKSAKIERINTEVKNIYYAIMGKFEEGTYGYLGDMGVIPKAVEMLGRQNQTTTPPGYDFVPGPPATWKQPGTSNIDIGGVTVQQIGWKGPYLTLTYDTNNYTFDPFGTRYRLDEDGDGLGDFQVISAGPNRTFGDSDDIKYPEEGISTQPDGSDRFIEGNLSLSVYVNNLRIDDVTTNYILYFSDKGGMGTVASPINNSGGSAIVPAQTSFRYGLHPINIPVGNKSLTFMVSILTNTHIHKDLFGTISADTGQTPDQVNINAVSCSNLNGVDGKVTVTWDMVDKNNSGETTLINLDRYEISTMLQSASLNHDWTIAGIVGPKSGSFTYIESGAVAASATIFVKVRAVSAAGAAIAWDSVSDSQSCTFIASSSFICGNNLIVAHTAGFVAPVDKTVTYETALSSLSGASKCWITQNLGATDQASSAIDSDESSAGWYWQFNRAQGYKHDGTTLTPAWTLTSIDENTDWTWVNDPCTLLLGTGWRLPTYTEWSNADSTGGWNNYDDTYASDLKLHAAGWLSYTNGLLSDRGGYGYYWSSTQATFTEGYNLNIDNSLSYMEFVNRKAYGISVRCLKD
ncbi:MAG: hypothetical protein V1872_05265, partial [bacterium]